ncbi:hypothetical protein EIP86_008417 [Pleurotus ostreatoroseus]|nr:hypothetical protein EIP86_008417 [Pleurotus ostreatoroseus]
MVLTRAMEPHIKLFHLLRQYDGIIIPPHARIPDMHPTLFCTYLKPGYLHILAFQSRNDNEGAISAHVLDSLPLSLVAETDTDLIDRMRVVHALYTLQRQVVRVCEAWNSVCWPQKVQIEEHEAIVDVTGIGTPTPSDVRPSSEEGHWLDLGIYVDSEDDVEYMEAAVAKSVQRVTGWLSGLDSSLVDVLDESSQCL